MAFDILSRVAALSPTNLTIREQTRLAENPLALRWRALAPPTDATSTKISEIEGADFRPVAEVRAWNADGREIHEVLGPQVSWQMLPITATKRIDEERLQELGSPNPALRQLIDDGIVADVDAWPTRLADAVDRRIEKAFFQGWLGNQYTVKDPKTGTTVTAALGMASSRYVTEGTIWSDAGVNAYDRLVFHLGEAERLMGSVGAVRLRRATANEIVKDAPDAANARRTTIATVQDRLSEEGFGDIALIVDERTYDDYDDGGSAYTTRYYVPTGTVAFQPAGGVVGRTPSVPNVRAYQYVDRDRRVNFRDVVTFYTPQNNGKTLLIEAERICLPVPIERNTYVVNAGV